MLFVTPKQIISAVLALGLVLGAAGCAAQKPEETKPPLETLAPLPVAEETEAPTEAATPAPTDAGEVPYEEAELSEAIRAYYNLDFYGCGCSFTECGEEATRRIMAMLPEELNGLSATVYRSDCCHTVAEARQHMAEFFGEELQGKFNDEYLYESEGELYVVVPARGGGGYEADLGETVRVDDRTIRTAVKWYDCGGEYYSLSSFTFCYNGSRYVLDGAKHGPVMCPNYFDVVSQRAVMKLTDQGDGEYLLHFSWAGSANEGSWWDFVCRYDDAADAFICQGKGTYTQWESVDDELQETILQEGMDAVIQYRDGALRVTSGADDLAGCEFRAAPFE